LGNRGHQEGWITLEEHVLIDARDVRMHCGQVRNAMVDRPSGLALCCLLAAGHPLVEDVPRRQDTLAGDRPRHRRPRLPHPVHR
jgi:hypothetical protein